MPKQEIDGDGLFNLALAMVGLVLQEGGIAVRELAAHFGVSEKAILKAANAITNSEDLTSPLSHFYLDWDAAVTCAVTHLDKNLATTDDHLFEQIQ